ncbi:MAG: hypothetical protein PHN69_08360 [Candidatus Pacebacteria bacterium]|nr:hypothetical protein [Candidatus Paceibacterota bacterium]
MSWFNKNDEFKCPLVLPTCNAEHMITRMIQKELSKNSSNLSDYTLSPDNLTWRVELAESKEASLARDISKLKFEVVHVKELLEHEITMCRPSNITSLMMRVDVVELRERDLRALICKQKKRSDELEARIIELEKKNREININIISKTEESKVEIQKGE